MRSRDRITDDDGRTPGGASRPVTVRLPAGPEAPGRARRELGAPLGGLGRDASERAALALSELVTNAVRHARLRDTDEIEVSVRPADGALRVEVRQPTEVQERTVRQVQFRDDGGLGLTIVERVTDRWGIDPGPPGRIWFEIH